jgi:DNA-binding MarR family transcriptional regulator
VNFLRAHAATTRRLNAELVANHGLTINDYEVLLHLAHAPERMLKRVDLVERLLLTPSGITRLLAGLETAGYVERRACATDARVVYAELTALFLDRFSAEERRTLAALLERLPLDGDDVACATD